MQRYQTGEHRSPRISSPSTCISARTRTTDMRHMEMPWCKRKQRSARYPEGQVLGRALVGGWLPSRRIPRVQPFSKPSLWNPSLSFGCWPNTGKKRHFAKPSRSFVVLLERFPSTAKDSWHFHNFLQNSTFIDWSFSKLSILRIVVSNVIECFKRIGNNWENSVLCVID